MEFVGLDKRKKNTWAKDKYKINTYNRHSYKKRKVDNLPDMATFPLQGIWSRESAELKEKKQEFEWNLFLICMSDNHLH